ncbi:retrovirus-related pol polyprotein from transposon TNT 1-94 [Tanacetum coccineum]
MQLNKEIFQKNNISVNQTEPSFNQLFELNNLKAELQAKDTTIEKLKANIKRLNKTSTTNNVKKDIDEIETINIELEHRVTKLITENEHLKPTYKQLYDSIKPSRVRAKEQTESLVNQLNQKNYKLYPVILAHKVKNNRENHKYYLKHTMEEAAILREVVEQAKSRNPLDSASYLALNSMNVHAKSVSKKNKKRKEWNPIGKVFNSTGYKWKPTGKTFTLVGNACPLTRLTATKKVPLRVPIPLEVVAPKEVVTRVYTRRPKVPKSIQNRKPKVAKSITANRMEPSTSRGSDTLVAPSSSSLIDYRDRSQPTNFVHKFLGTVKFDNDQVVKIMGYGDYQIGNVTISKVYYVEGLRHNLFSVGQFCDSDLEVAFRKHTCFVRNLKGVDLLSGSRGTNLYSLSIGDMMVSSPICLMSKATKTKSWLWHRRLSHLNFGAINHLARHGLVRGLPRLKFEKDHLCSACAMGKSKKQSHKPKSKDTNQEKLYLLHMDLCGPMRVASVNGKKYILVIVDDYSWFTWVKFLASKDEAPDFIIKFLKMIQVRLNATVRNIHTDNRTEFVNQTLRDYYEQVGISHETSIARTLQQNGVVEWRNHTLVEAARTMLIFAKAPLFIWAEAIATFRTRLQCMTPTTPSLGLVPNPPPSAQFVPPSRHEWDLMFQPVFDEFLSPLASVASPVPVEEALAFVELTGSPSSTTVNQDASSPSTSQTTPQSQSQTIPLSVEEESHDLKVAYMSNDPYFGILIPGTISEESSSSDVISTTVHSDSPISEHLRKWTNGHPLQNIIGDPSRPVFTRLQLHEQALFCYYDAFLTSVEPKTYKDALTQSCWIEAMQEELHEFERLEVWELVPRLDKVMVIILKWIYKVKLDELGGILKNKARLVV